jgi:hypothetical protein
MVGGSRKRANLRRFVAEEEVELVVSVSAGEFQELVRMAFALPPSTVGDIVRECIRDGIAAWPVRLDELLAELNT